MTVGSRLTAPGGHAQASILTFLIADIRGYTTFTRSRGDEAGARLAAVFAEIAREGVEAFDGTVVELRGDEALAVFHSPRSALRAAAELQSVFADETALHPALPLRVGIGLDAGEAVPVEDGFRGGALNLAARLCAKAGPGEILATAGVVHLAGTVTGVAITPHSELVLKGIESPVRAFSVALADDRRRRLIPSSDVRHDDDRGRSELPPELDPVTPLIGRDLEARSLRWQWRATRGGRGRVVIVSGSRGSGRTRLAAEPAIVAVRDRARATYVRYGTGGPPVEEPADAELAEVLPGVRVIDDLDAARPEELEDLARAVERLTGQPTLLIVTVDEEAGEEPVHRVLRRVRDEDAARHMSLPSLDEAAVAAICSLYSSGRGEPLPVRAILEASGGIPARVHELAIEWASADAAQRLGRNVTKAVTRRRGLRMIEAAVSSNVVDFQRARAQANLFSRDGPGGPAGPEDGAPFKGLASYGMEDAPFFFGRERLVAELVGRLAGASFLGVVGPSGSGKSSAVLAGLAPSLASGILPGSDEWIRVVLRPGERPTRELDRAIYAALPESLRSGLTRTEEPIGTATALLGDRRLLIVIDQFEEVFTTCRDEDERVAFVDRLVSGAGPAGAVVVAAVRADFYGRCAAYPALAALLAQNHVLVGPMTATEYGRAIEQPAALAGVRVEAALVDALIEDVGDEPGGLPLLSTALLELWERRDRRLLTEALYRTTGGVRGAVARLAEAAYASLSESEQRAARAVLLRLASSDGASVVRRRVELAEFDSAVQPNVATALERLIEARLLTSGEGTVEIAHEALLREWPRLVEWLDEDRVGRQLREHVTQTAKAWQASGREPGELYRGARLAAALEWTDDHAGELNALEREFLAESRLAAERDEDHQRRVNRRLRLLLAGVALLSVVSFAAGALAIALRGQAEQAAANADQQRAAAERVALISEAQRVGAEGLQQDLDRSLLLAGLGVELYDSPETRANLLAALLRSPSAEHVLRPLAGSLDRVTANANGSRLLVRNADRTIAVLDGHDGRVLWQFDPGDQALSFDQNVGSADVSAFAPDGSIVLARVEPRRLDFFNADTGALLSDRSRLFPSAVDAVAWSADGRLVAATDVGGGGAEVDDAATGRTIRRIDPPAGMTFMEVAIYGDGHLLTLLHRGALPDDHDPRADAATYAWWPPTGDRPTAMIPREAADAAWPFAVSPDLRTLAVGRPDGSVTLYDLGTGTRRDLLGHHAGEVTVVKFSPDSRRLITTGRERIAMVWDVASGQPQGRLAAHNGDILDAALSTQDGRETAYTVGTDGALIAWDLSGELAFLHPFTAAAENFGPIAPAFAVGGQGPLLAVPQGDGAVVVRDARTLDVVQSIAGNGEPAYDVDFSPDGRLLAVSGRAANLIRVYDTHSWQPAAGWAAPTTIAGGTAAGFSVAFSPDGRLLALGGSEGQIFVLDARSGASVRPPLQADGSVWDVAFSPHSDLLVAAVNNRASSRAIAWSVVDGRRAYLVEVDSGGNGRGATGITFSPNGRTLATTGSTGDIRYSDAETGAALGRSHVSTGGWLESARYDASGALIVTADESGSVRLIDGASHAFVGPPLPGTVDAPASAMFTPDGTRVVVVYNTGSAFVLDATLEAWMTRACMVAGRDLTDEERAQFVPDRPTAKVCP